MSSDTTEDTAGRRVCGTACHHARRMTCNCWCDGLFHGEAGRNARRAFRELTGILPTKNEDDPHFQAALEIARKQSAK